MNSQKLSILICVLIAISQFSPATALSCIGQDGNSVACGATITQCFITTAAGNVVTRGCNDPATNPTCTAPACQTCLTDNCNYLTCKQCTSSNLAECATSNAASAPNQLCPELNQQCQNTVNSDGILTRGCGPACTTAQCTSCPKDNCNIGIYPTNRLQCNQCNGPTCNTVTEAMNMPCVLFQGDTQKCYSIGTSDQTMQRGCSTDTNAKCGAGTTDAACLMCTGNGCNNLPYTRSFGKCIQCNDATTCKAAQTADKATACPNVLYTVSETSCYTQVLPTGAVARGCSSQLSTPCGNAENCSTCTGDACNINEPIAGPSCIICRSDNFAGCRKGSGIGGEACKDTSVPYKCFEGQWDGIVVRGCLNDAPPLMKSQCENAADNRCTSCDSRDCNTKNFNGASTMQHMGLGLLLAMIFIVRQSL